MRHGGPGQLLFENHLRLLVIGHTLIVVVGAFGVDHQLVEIFVAPARIVVAAHGFAAQERAQPVVGVAIVAGPAHDNRIRLAFLRALEVFAPFISDQLGFHAHFGPIGLHHFRHQLGVGVIRALHRHIPQVEFLIFGHTGFFQKRFGFFGIVRCIFEGFVVAPLGGRHRVGGFDAGTLIHGIDDGIFVDRHIQRLAHFHLAQFAVLDVVAQIAHVEARLIHHGDFAGFFGRFDFGRFRIGGHIAFAGLHFLRTHGRIFGDHKHQVVDVDIVFIPIIGVFGIADLRVFLVRLKHKRSGAHRLGVDVGRFAFFHQFIGVFGRIDIGKRHGDVLQEGRFHFFEGDFNGVVVYFFNRLNQIGQAHVD